MKKAIFVGRSEELGILSNERKVRAIYSPASSSVDGQTIAILVYTPSFALSCLEIGTLLSVLRPLLTIQCSTFCTDPK